MRPRLVHFVMASCVLAMFGLNGRAIALDGMAIMQNKCVSCHNVAGPAPGTFTELLERKAPDLFYAGSKFNRPWLFEWLQNPTAIRPAGVMFLNHIVNQDGKDQIDEATVKLCASKLSVEEAEGVTDFMMTLTDPAMKTGIIDPTQKFRIPKAYNLFAKRMPCIACHGVMRGKREMGGTSGPDLTEAGERLNPDWIYARIEDPQYWDPKTWMPRIEMSHNKRELLTLFLSSMK